MSEVSVMDIARPEANRKRRNRRYIFAGTALVLVVLVTAALAQLKPAAPTVDRSANESEQVP
jgi:hypothetical protein